VTGQARRRRQLDAEQGVASDQALNVDGGVGGNETSGVERGISVQYQVMNRRDKAGRGYRSGVKARDEIGEVASDPCPDELGKGP
jgi:hypothetical protein